jgi:hypothetical protein
LEVSPRLVATPSVTLEEAHTTGNGEVAGSELPTKRAEEGVVTGRPLLFVNDDVSGSDISTPTTDGSKSLPIREGRNHVNECYPAGYHHKGRTFR